MTDVLKNKKCLIFDLDGTLIDSLALWMYAYPLFDTIEETYKIFKPIYNSGISEKPGAAAFLKKLHDAGFYCVIATATDLSVCGGCIRRLGFDKYIDGAYCCSDFHTNKTKPLFYEEVLKATGFRKEDALIFEDNPSWAKVAADAGFDILGVWDRHTDELDRFSGFACACVKSFDEIEIPGSVEITNTSEKKG